MKKKIFIKFGLVVLATFMPIGFILASSCSSIEYPIKVFYNKTKKEIHIELDWSDSKYWADRSKAYHLQQAVNKEIAKTIKSIPQEDHDLFKEHFFNTKDGISKDFLMDHPYFWYKRMKSNKNLMIWKAEYEKKYNEQWSLKNE